MNVGQRKDAKTVRYGVGGKAFPNDYNWECPVCQAENRAFEGFCPHCQHRIDMAEEQTKNPGTA